jgi:hypothetical protein
MKDVNGNRRRWSSRRVRRSAPAKPRRGGIAARSPRATIGRARAQATVRVWKKRLELQAHSGLGSEAPADFRSTSPQARLEVSVSFEERRGYVAVAGRPASPRRGAPHRRGARREARTRPRRPVSVRGLCPRRGSGNMVGYLAALPCEELHTFGGWIGYLIAGFIGACILIAIARAFSGGLQQRT